MELCGRGVQPGERMTKRKLLGTFDSPKPKINEKIVPAKLIKHWNRVFYKPSQVERSLPCIVGLKIEPGLRLAMLFPHGEFLAVNGKVPESKFYTGTVTEITGSGLTLSMTIKFDGNPFCPGIFNCGVKYYEIFCIPLPNGMK